MLTSAKGISEVLRLHTERRCLRLLMLSYEIKASMGGPKEQQERDEKMPKLIAKVEELTRKISTLQLQLKPPRYLH